MRHLLELYRHDLSEFDDRDVDLHGLYGYPYLDDYWVDADRLPFLIDVDGRWAGFALVRLGPPVDMSEFIEQAPIQRVLDTVDYHSSPEEAAQTAARCAVGTLMLTHYFPPPSGDDAEEYRARASEHFDGTVEVGDDLHRVEIGRSFPP